jgi:signal transduction histidine kinase
VERTAAIVRDVKGFAHRGQSEPEPVDLNEVLRDVLRIAHPELRDRVQVELHPGSIALVSGVAQELKQVFLNLVVNANQAIADTGTICVTTSQEDGHVSVRIEDDGCGISAEDQERIFDPFFTTKPVGEGVGLGLAITHEIVRNHGAELLVDSELGRGTTLTVRFRALELLA